MQYNDAAIIRGGMSLVPNLREQLIQDATLELQRRQVDNDTAVITAKRQEAQTEAELSAAYQRDLEAALLEGTPQAIRRLQTKYPATTKDASEAFNALDDDIKASTLTQMGSIYERAAAGDFAGAAQKVEQRISADKAAGEDTSEDQEILAGLRSEDPLQRRVSVSMIAHILRIIAGDKFDAVTKALEPEAKTPLEREYEFNVRTYGKAYADAVNQSKNTDRIAVQPGGTVFEAGPTLPTSQGGGDPSGSGVGMDFGAFWSVFDLEGTPGAVERSKTTPVRVRSQQEVAALPRGAHFIDPRDGVTVRAKP